MYFEAKRNRVKTHTLYFDSLPSSFDGVRLFFISDIHRRQISLSIIEEIKGNVDVIIIGGDLLEKGVPLSRVENNLRLLRSIAPTYFVWGNNDYEGDVKKLDALLLENQIHVLANSLAVFEQNEDKLVLIGVDDIGQKRDNIEEAMTECPDGFHILISHNPLITKKLTSNIPIHLILSGHTHGGQIRILGWGLEKKGAIHFENSRVHLISNGYGTTSVPLRLGAPAETHLICLRTKTHTKP
ncbi:metallophosphoesterase [Halalkalibacterium ligniniphilum]|uniref:metallophosphoesterase n=1 Tax=Halalkalibacterium ligniniphilum TaxID=1134413 RepID=UPI0009D9D6DC|nr:metallophosphoesterase [Halalkalibacterium ligniniphilum]